MAHRDHERLDSLLRVSNLNWGLKRSPGFATVKKKQKVEESYNNLSKARLTISRRSLAKYMIKAVEYKGLNGKYLTVSV